MYAVGHRALSLEARRLAAVLAAGPGAVLSHSAAGAHWGIVTSGTRIDVTVPRRPHARRGFRLHHAVLPADETTVHRAIAVTTVPRTILDLAAILPSYRLERAVSEAERLRLWDARSLHDLIGRYPRRPGTPALRAVLARGVAPTRSDLEAAFLGFLDAHGLPRPDVNTPTGGREVDCRWRRQRLIAEVDGGGVHGTRAAFERDRARDRALVVAGWRVVRVTWRQLHDDPAALAAEFRALLAKYP